MSLAKTAGKGVSFNLNGKEYKVSVLTVNDLAEFDSHVKTGRLKTFLACTKDMPKEEKAEIIINILHENVNIFAEMQTMESVRFLFWRSLLPGHPKLTLEQVGEMVTLDNIGEVHAIINNVGADGEDEKN